MRIGMLWFNNDPKADLKAKIEGAVSYYIKKYGEVPNLCFVHPSMVNGQEQAQNGIEIRTDRSVPPNHFWIGQAEAQHGS